MWPEPERRGAPRPHAYDLFEDGRPIGRLEWRNRPRREVGWYVTRPPRPGHRLHVDPSIDGLARDAASSDHDWDLNAELSAILSTALAVDAAERFLHPQAARITLEILARDGAGPRRVATPGTRHGAQEHRVLTASVAGVAALEAEKRALCLSVVAGVKGGHGLREVGARCCARAHLHPVSDR